MSTPPAVVRRCQPRGHLAAELLRGARPAPFEHDDPGLARRPAGDRGGGAGRADRRAGDNELAIMCERLGVDVWEVIDAAATKPFGFMKFTPGPGLGGHCIPIDPLYLSWKMKALDYNARFIDLASEINTNMPRYVVGRILEAMNDRSMTLKDSKVLVLGVAYKPNIDDVRESPALDVIGLLQKKGAKVSYHDPYIPHIHHEYEGWKMDSVEDVMQMVKESDAVVIVTDHSMYDYAVIVDTAKFVFDSRNALGKLAKGNPKVERL